MEPSDTLAVSTVRTEMIVFITVLFAVIFTLMGATAGFASQRSWCLLSAAACLFLALLSVVGAFAN